MILPKFVYGEEEVVVVTDGSLFIAIVTQGKKFFLSGWHDEEGGLDETVGDGVAGVVVVLLCVYVAFLVIIND